MPMSDRFELCFLCWVVNLINLVFAERFLKSFINHKLMSCKTLSGLENSKVGEY